VISKPLEQALHDSFVSAHGKQQKWITVEHLLLQLLSVPPIQERLTACGIDARALHTELESCVSRTEAFPESESGSTEPTAAFQKLIEHAILRVQKAGRAEVTPIDIFETVALQSKHVAVDPAVQRRIGAFRS
jgi:ATP-dependent Clp protease ATP-binding subunit ClpA